MGISALSRTGVSGRSARPPSLAAGTRHGRGRAIAKRGETSPRQAPTTKHWAQNKVDQGPLRVLGSLGCFATGSEGAEGEYSGVLTLAV